MEIMRRRTLLIISLLCAGVIAGWAAGSPEVAISNKQLRVKMYLPDPQNGFYKGARFDWSGIINSVEFAGQERPQSTTPSVELDNLKQFRDCHDMDAAIYRAIVASRTVHTEIADVFFYDGADVELDFMWSDSVKQMLHSLFETKGRTKPGPPPEHRGPSRRSAHSGPNVQSADWDMPRLTMPVEFGFSYISNVTFEVIDTIHTYGVAKRSGGDELPL